MGKKNYTFCIFGAIEHGVSDVKKAFNFFIYFKKAYIYNFGSFILVLGLLFDIERVCDDAGFFNLELNHPFIACLFRCVGF